MQSSGKRSNENFVCDFGIEETMSSCDTCSNYQYDEDYECYVCMVDLDEDDMSRFLRGGNFECSFYQLDNEYLIVRKQM